MRFRGMLQLRYLMPFGLMLTVGALVGLRFLPTRYCAFRAWEVSTRYPTPGSPMQANFHYHNEQEYGDLARVGNLPNARVIRSVTFTTDSLGFRNAPSPLDGNPPAVMIFGTSMSCGSGMSDEETLGAQLSGRLGARVYNTAPGGRDIDTIRQMTRQLGMRKGIVIVEQVERYILPASTGSAAERRVRPPAGEDSLPASAGRVLEKLQAKLSQRWFPSIDDKKRLLDAWYRVNPASIFSQSALRRLQNDRLLPNSYRANVVEKPLPDGGRMLFLPALLTSTSATFDRQEVEHWTQLADELRKDNLTLLVLLVPEKHTVYLPLLEPPVPGATGESCLDSLEAELKEHDIPVVNLLPLYRKEAAAGLKEGNYLYWPDDTHWTPRGVEIAAELICRKLRSADEGETPCN